MGVNGDGTCGAWSSGEGWRRGENPVQTAMRCWRTRRRLIRDRPSRAMNTRTVDGLQRGFGVAARMTGAIESWPDPQGGFQAQGWGPGVGLTAWIG